MILILIHIKMGTLVYEITKERIRKEGDMQKMVLMKNRKILYRRGPWMFYSEN